MIRLLAAAALLSTFPLSALAQDKAGCADHPLFKTRMPGYSIQKCKVEEFGAHDFSLKPRVKNPIEGKITQLTYVVADRKDQPSALAVVRNYENAIQSVGGTIVEIDPNRWVTGKVVKDGLETWVKAEKGNGLIWLYIAEKQAMQQYVVADAAALGSDLQSTGHVAVYGIYFDTNKSEVKPDSKPALEEIAKLLKAEPGLKLKVVGHTDLVGSLDSNMKLSQARAEAVVKALTAEHGIAAGRLTAHGVGPLCPIASNDAEPGRAKNRRVELVKE